MSANMAHFFIADSALKKYYKQTKDVAPGAATMLNSYHPFFLLGSIGPDLPNYKVGSILFKAIEQDVGWRPVDADGWAYMYHSVNPNEMPTALFNIILKDSQNEPIDAQQTARFAFATGWLCHIVTDRIIHPIVNAYAGNYYKSWHNTKKHMHCEIEQDLWCYAHYKGGGKIDGFLKEEPEKWIDLKRGKARGAKRHIFNSEEIEGFAMYIARASMEAYGVPLSYEEVQTWLRGINIAIGKMDDWGPVKKTAKKIKGKSIREIETALSECVNKKFIEAIPKAEKECLEKIEFAVDIFGYGPLKQPMTGDKKQKILEDIGDEDLTNPPQ